MPCEGFDGGLRLAGFMLTNCLGKYKTLKCIVCIKSQFDNVYSSTYLLKKLKWKCVWFLNNTVHYYLSLYSKFDSSRLKFLL